MKLIRPFRPQQLLFVPVLSLMLATSVAQDSITKSDGTTMQAKVLGVSGSNLQIQVGAGSIGIPLSTVSKVVMPAPPEFSAALAAYEKRDYPKALAAAKSVVDRFKGLPADWAQQSMDMLGNLYLAMNRLPEAEAAFKDVQKVYPGTSSLQADVGMARIAVARKDYNAAKPKLAQITEGALKLKTVPRGDALAYSQAFLLLGQINEAQNEHADALQNYLRTVTLFPQDRIAVADAQAKADALRKAHPAATVP